jgi:hypothetical protein
MPVQEMIHQEDDKMDKSKISRRQFLKTTAYVAPAILTLKAVPALVQAGSPLNNNQSGGQQPCDPYGVPSKYGQLIQ